VFIDKKGIVRLYHPGKMSMEELRAAMDRILSPATETRNASAPAPAR
jgi:hypothetical protein